MTNADVLRVILLCIKGGDLNKSTALQKLKNKTLTKVLGGALIVEFCAVLFKALIPQKNSKCTFMSMQY